MTIFSRQRRGEYPVELRIGQFSPDLAWTSRLPVYAFFLLLGPFFLGHHGLHVIPTLVADEHDSSSRRKRNDGVPTTGLQERGSDLRDALDSESPMALVCRSRIHSI